MTGIKIWLILLGRDQDSQGAGSNLSTHFPNYSLRRLVRVLPGLLFRAEWIKAQLRQERSFPIPMSEASPLNKSLKSIFICLKTYCNVKMCKNLRNTNWKGVKALPTSPGMLHYWPTWRPWNTCLFGPAFSCTF